MSTTRTGLLSATALLAIAGAGYLALSTPAEAGISVTGYLVNNGIPGAVALFDTGTHTFGATAAVGEIPNGVAITPDGRYVYSANSGTNDVTVLDATTGAFLRTINVGNTPSSITASPDGKFVYVNNFSSDTVSIIDTSTQQVIDTIPAGGTPQISAISPDGKTLYVPISGGTISVIDTATHAITHTITGLTSLPASVAISPDGNFLYVAGALNNSVQIVSTQTNTVTATVSLSGGGGTLWNLAITPDGRSVYVITSQNHLEVINTATQNVVDIPTSGLTDNVSITPDGRFAYVTASDGVEIFDTITNTLAATIPYSGGFNSIGSSGNFLGPNVIVAAGGAVQVGSNADLDTLGFGNFVNFNGGTLQATADLSIPRFISLLADGGTVDTNGFTVTLPDAIIGQSTLTKIGAGTLVLEGANPFSGTTHVQAGTLIIGSDLADNNASIAGDIDVESGAAVSGYGSVFKLDNNGGTVTPGGQTTADPIGTLAVGGKYTQTAAGTLRIIVTPAGASQLAVTGAAQLDGTLGLAFAPGTYRAKTYTVLTAAGGITGGFDQVVTEEGDPSGLPVTTTQDTNQVDLLLAGGTPVGGGGGGTVSVAPTDGHVLGATTSSLISGTQIANRSLFDHLGDQRFGADTDALHTAFAGSNPAQVAFDGDMAALNNIVACLPEALARNGGWFRALGGFGNIDSTNGAPGIDSYGGGFMAGYDRALTDNFLLGIAAGYTRTQIDGDDNSNASIDTPRVSLYGSYHLGGFALDTSVGYAFDRIKSHDVSDGGDAKSKHDAHEINAALQASYSVKLPNAFVLTPHTGLDYLHIFEDGYNEHGAGAFDLQAESSDTDSLRPQVGVGVSRSFATDNGWHLIPQVDLTYSREMLDNKHDANVVVGGGSFTVDGLSQSRDQLALNLDLTAQLSETVDLSLGYTQILPVGNTTSYNFTGGVRVLF